jgi:hypothetical protein
MAFFRISARFDIFDLRDHFTGARILCKRQRSAVSTARFQRAKRDPLMPEEMEKTIREMPRNAEVIDLPKKLSGEIVES